MRVQDITAIEEVKADLNHGEAFYDLQQAGLGIYFRDCIISDIESLRLYGGIHSQHGGIEADKAERVFKELIKMKVFTNNNGKVVYI